MPSEVLRVESSILHYGVPPNEHPYSEQIGQLLVRELYSPTRESELPSGVQSYQVIIEATVSSREEAWKAKFEAFELAEELDRAWVYVCGRPLHPVHLQLQFLDSPRGWSTNAKGVDVRLAQAEGRPYVTLGLIKDRHWIQMPFFPLRESLRVREALRIAPEPTSALVDLHYSALKSLDSNGKLFLLAKGLELSSRLLPGKDKKAREKSLPENIRSAISHSLDWLFNISNNRFDVRHVVKDPQGPQLHQRMTPEERAVFTEDADLVIRTIVCQQIGRPAFVVRHQ
jgi:hypothetical protein